MDFRGTVAVDLRQERNAKAVFVFAHMELGDIEQAQNHFQKALEMEAAEDLRGLAEYALEDCGREIKARAEPRIDEVFCPTWYCWRFHTGSRQRSGPGAKRTDGRQRSPLRSDHGQVGSLRARAWVRRRSRPGG